MRGLRLGKLWEIVEGFKEDSKVDEM